MSLAIRAARPADSALIFALVRELADYEKLSAEVDATEEQIAAALFGEQPRVFLRHRGMGRRAGGLCPLVSRISRRSAAGPASISRTFSCGPTFRQRGIGKALLKRLAQRCVDEGWARFEWAVLDWNAPAIAFYNSLGAEVLDDWRICRLSGAALQRFAGEGAPR